MIEAGTARDPVATADGPHAGMWQQLAFAGVAIGWAPMSLIAWFAAIIAIVDWTGADRSAATGAGLGGPMAVVATVLSAGLFVLGGVVLISLARWAFPGRRRLATALGSFALVWAPTLAMAWAAAR